MGGWLERRLFLRNMSSPFEPVRYPRSSTVANNIGHGDGGGDAPRRDAREGPRLLDSVRDAIRRRHYSPRTEERYVHWIKRFIYFSDRRHPRELGAAEVTALLNHLARERNVAASTQNQALSALLFLYREALGTPLPWLDELERAQRPARLPTVLTATEVRQLLDRMRGTTWPMASLDVSTTMIYTHVLNKRGRGVASPLERRT